MDRAAALATVLTTLAVDISLSNDVVVVDLVVLGEAYKKKKINIEISYAVQFK